MTDLMNREAIADGVRTATFDSERANYDLKALCSNYLYTNTLITDITYTETPSKEYTAVKLIAQRDELASIIVDTLIKRDFPELYKE